jgi:3beta-hydroxy-delta5-steroid dehydrogenase/steroid delta-isomerase
MATPASHHARRVLITGGAGFLAAALVRELRKPGHEGESPPDEIRLFDVRPVDTDGEPGVVALQGDVRSLPQLLEACRGVDAVLHTASLVDYGHASEATLEAINVGGVETVIRACREEGVPALVHTSTMDVIYAGRPVVDADETVPYPTRFADAYARTKARGEQRAVAENDAQLRTCAIRPCGMYGEGDPYHVSNVLRIARSGGLSARLGAGTARFQHVYVGNVAHAQVLAMRDLLRPDSRAAGQVYIITDTPAVNFFDFMAPIVERLGQKFPPKSRRVPYPLAYAVGTVVEITAKLLRPLVAFQPTITRSSVRIVCQDFCFDGSKATRDLGYKPVYSEAESLDRTVAWFAEHGPVALPQIPETR